MEQQPKPPIDWRDLQARPFTLEDLAWLLASANAVVDSWAEGNLAEAVNDLDAALKDLGARETWEVADEEEKFRNEFGAEFQNNA